MNCNTTHYRANSSSVPGDPTPLLDPYEAATRRKGAPLLVGGTTLTIAELFFTKTLSADGQTGAAAWAPVEYGFLTRGANESVVARWTESGIQFFQGRALAETEVIAAFRSKPGMSP